MNCQAAKDAKKYEEEREEIHFSLFPLGVRGGLAVL